MKALPWRSSAAVTAFVALASTLYFATRPDNREICARWSAGSYPYDRPDPTLPIERDRQTAKKLRLEFNEENHSVLGALSSFCNYYRS
ncbi:hypothetical protein OMCYN_01640 [cyanobiont of Ornithocercus magnificus]|nr:hypothetical protein OMCYN_01640 [cyanobiont of Ornithocercus magnificus]